MGQNLNFLMITEQPALSPRALIVDQICKTFDNNLGAPEEIMILNWTTNAMQQVHWDVGNAVEHPLSVSEIMFVYLGNSMAPLGRSSIGFAPGTRRQTINISLGEKAWADMEKSVILQYIEKLSSAHYCFGDVSLIAVGLELEIKNSDASIEDIIRDLTRADSLMVCISLPRSRSPDKLGHGFEKISRGEVTVFWRGGKPDESLPRFMR